MLLSPKVAFLLSLSLGCVLYFTLDRSGWESIVVTILGFLGFGGFRPTVIALKTLPRDIQLVFMFIRIQVTPIYKPQVTCSVLNGLMLLVVKFKERA